MKARTSRDTTRGQIILYKNKLEVRLEEDTVWLTQKQMAELFDTERSVITKHLGNVFNTGELVKNSVCAFFAHTANDGKTYQTQFYNLDAIISVGYRVNSVRGTQFRIWATNVLRKHLVDGYTINEKRLKAQQAKAASSSVLPSWVDSRQEKVSISLLARKTFRHFTLMMRPSRKGRCQEINCHG